MNTNAKTNSHEHKNKRRWQNKIPWFVLLPFLFCFVHVLSVLLRFTDSDYPLVSSNSSHNTKQLHKHDKHTKHPVSRATRWVSLLEQDLPTLPEQLSSPRFLVGFMLLDLLYEFYVYVLQIVVYPFALCYFDHCVVCSSLIYRF